MFACGQGVEDVTDVSFHKGPCTGTENAYSSAYSTCSLFADTRHHLLGKSATAKTDCGVCEETVQGLILECGTVAQTGDQPEINWNSLDQTQEQCRQAVQQIIESKHTLTDLIQRFAGRLGSNALDCGSNVTVALQLVSK